MPLERNAPARNWTARSTQGRGNRCRLLVGFRQLESAFTTLLQLLGGSSGTHHEGT